MSAATAIQVDVEELMRRQYLAVMSGETFRELFGNEFQFLRAAIEARNWPEIEDSIKCLERSAAHACEQHDVHFERAETAEAKLSSNKRS